MPRYFWNPSVAGSISSLLTFSCPTKPGCPSSIKCGYAVRHGRAGSPHCRVSQPPGSLLCYPARLDGLPAASLRRRNARVWHELLRTAEPVDINRPGDDRECGHAVFLHPTHRRRILAPYSQTWKAGRPRQHKGIQTMPGNSVLCGRWDGPARTCAGWSASVLPNNQDISSTLRRNSYI